MEDQGSHTTPTLAPGRSGLDSEQKGCPGYRLQFQMLSASCACSAHLLPDTAAVTPAGSHQAHTSFLGCHLSAPGERDASSVPTLKAHLGLWKMNYVSFISKKQSWSPFVIKFAVRETLLYRITSDISWLLVLETIKV